MPYRNEPEFGIFLSQKPILRKLFPKWDVVSDFSVTQKRLPFGTAFLLSTGFSLLVNNFSCNNSPSRYQSVDIQAGHRRGEFNFV